MTWMKYKLVGWSNRKCKAMTKWILLHEWNINLLGGQTENVKQWQNESYGINEI